MPTTSRPKKRKPALADQLPPATDWRTTDEHEILKRRLRAREDKARVENLTHSHPVFSNFAVHSPSGLTYQVEIRDLGTRQHACTCTDFRINGLGTCKHVEAVLLHLARRAKPALKLARATGSPRLDLVPDPATNTLRVERNADRLPARLRALFDSSGQLHPDITPENALDALRHPPTSRRHAPEDAGQTRRPTRCSRPSASSPPPRRRCHHLGSCLPAKRLPDRHATRRDANCTPPRRFPTYDTPRFLLAGELHPDRLVLPRGVIAEAAQLFRRAGGHLRLTDQRPTATPRAFTFHGTLKPPQQTALNALLPHDDGVLVAPPGAGKTVIACALLAQRGVPALILVHRTSLLEQWRERLATFLNLSPRDIHRLGGPKRTATATVALGMLQTLARSPHPEALLAPYPHVIIDECHHIPAAGFEAVMKTCPARFILGLTATPRRKDGLQKLLHLQCGPVRHHFTPPQNSAAATLPRRLIIRHCSPNLPEPDAPIHQLWSALVTSRERNEQIAANLVACLCEGRAIAVLSDRRDHLTELQAATARLLNAPQPDNGHGGLSAFAIEACSFLPRAATPSSPPHPPPTLHRIDGTTSRRERANILADLQRLSDFPTFNPAPFALFATASLLGEGFDLPRLDTLFLTTPVSFSGRVVQYAGRLHRAHPAKTDVRIYDYHEPTHRLSAHMHRKRLATLRTLGYALETSDPAPLPLLP
jgi:superfamily II DNA or RNA helicase